MTFTEMRDKLIEHFEEMTKDVTHLFEVNLDKDQLWDLYLDSFPAGTNTIYRERREHDCSCCRQFIKSIGNVVSIKNGIVTTIWDFRTDDDTYQPVLDALSLFVKTHNVSDVYISDYNKIGCLQNYEQLEYGGTKAWDHFYLELPDKFIRPREYTSVEAFKGKYRDRRNVFKRSLDEISEEAIETILELITSNTLYKGEEWKSPLTKFLEYKKEYDLLSNHKALYAWKKSIEAGDVIGRIRNHSIGTLLVNVSEGMDLDLAVKKYEQFVAPSNYKRPKEIYTKKMLEDAKNTITELGYLDSLPRRFATLDDISVNNILFSNRDVANRIVGAVDIFGEMEREAITNPKKFSKVEEIPIDKFVKDILPTAREIELYLENRHASNMVSLIAPENKDTKTMFKWNNNFGWAYAGNMTDSMKERVKAAGGSVDGVLRFSIQWNETGTDNSDLDAHCREPLPYGTHIYYGSNRSLRTNGWLDVDIRQPRGNVAVENISWPNRKQMIPGVYQLFVIQYEARGTNNGFKAEIEFDGQIYQFEYNKPIKTGEKVPVAEVTLSTDGQFSIKELLPSNVSSKDIWNVKSNQFVPVSVVMYSPNYWDDQDGIGHRHYFFMLKDCVNPETPNGFYNEFLKNELVEHKRVFAALGSKMAVKPVDDQLSGIGFSATKRDDLIVKVKGNTERVMKIKF